MIRSHLALAVLTLAALSAHAQPALPCPQPAPEYCAVGCEDLGAWVVQPFESVEEAFAALLALDQFERTSAMVVQTPLGNVLLRRERRSNPAHRPSLAEPHWEIEEYGSPMHAAATAHVKGGWVYATNGGDTAAVRIWWVNCGVDPDARKRSVRR